MVVPGLGRKQCSVSSGTEQGTTTVYAREGLRIENQRLLHPVAARRAARRLLHVRHRTRGSRRWHCMLEFHADVTLSDQQGDPVQRSPSEGDRTATLQNHRLQGFRTLLKRPPRS